MKHILNNLTEEEKNSIREQHTGGMKVMTENFNKLLNSKLGDSKPLVDEQVEENDPIGFIKVYEKKGHKNTWSVQATPDGKFKIFVKTPKYKTYTNAAIVFGRGRSPRVSPMWKEYSTKEEAQKTVDRIINMQM